jgi:hypothetical protein
MPVAAPSRKLGLLGLVAGAVLSLLLAAPALAGPPGTWTKLERNNTASSSGVGGVRTTDGTLHLLWSHVNSSPGNDELVDVPVAADGTVGAPAPITTGWSFLGQPAALLDGSAMRAVFDGDAPSTVPPGTGGGYSTTFPAGGTAWSTPSKISKDVFQGGVTGATLGSAGTLFSTFPATRVHRGTNPADADNQFQSTGTTKNQNVATDAQSGAIWAAWGSNESNVVRTRVRQVDPLTGAPLGAAVDAPLPDGTPFTFDLDQRAALTGRPGNAGVYLAYARQTAPFQVLLWRVGDPTPQVVATSQSPVGLPAVAARPDGRLWVVWRTTNPVKIFARLSNAAVTAFSDTIELSPPAATGNNLSRVQAFAGPDKLDLVVAGLGEAGENHTQLQAPTGNGTLSGHVYNTVAGAALEGARVQVCEGFGGACRLRTTDSAGAYTVDDLPAGTYKVTAFPPGSANLYPGTRTQDSVLADGGNLTGQDVILSAPKPLPQGIAMTTRFISGQGVPVQHEASSTDIFFVNDEGYDFKISLQDPDTGQEVTCQDCGPGPLPPGDPIPPEDPTGPKYPPLPPGQDPPPDRPPPPGTTPPSPAQGKGNYLFRLRPFKLLTFDLFGHSLHGDVTLVITGSRAGSPDIRFVFNLYIDPSGNVRTVNGTPIVGASVTLYRSDSAAGPFAIIPNGSDTMSPINRKNPDSSDFAGHFGWDVIAGYYKVRAQKAGCFSPSNPGQAFVDSAVLTIPPPVTDLDLRLNCTAPSGGGAGSSGAFQPGKVGKSLLLVSLSAPRNAGTVTVGKHGAFTLSKARAACPAGSNGSCSLAVSVTGPGTTKSGAAKKKRKKALKLGTLRFSVAAGKTQAVRGKLSRKGLARLKRARRIKATVSIKATVPGGGGVTRTVKATLKRPRR